MTAMKDNVSCLLDALQMTQYNLDIKFDMRYYLKSDHRKALLLRQNGLFEDTKVLNTNIFVDQEYEDIQLEKLVETFRANLVKQEVQFTVLPAEQEESEVFKDENLISAED